MLKVYANTKVAMTLASDLSLDLFWHSPVMYQVYGNARILPSLSTKRFTGGVCTEAGDFVGSTTLHEDAYDGSYKYSSDSVERKDCDAVFLGTWVGIYGHAITDNIKKLWFLFTEEYKQLDPETELIYNYLGNGELPGYLSDILSSLNIDIKSLTRVDRVTEYRNVIVPDNSFILNEGIRYYTDNYRSLVSTICMNAASLECYPEKIYLSRKRAMNLRDYGEEFIEDAFSQHGYTVISPEDYSFAEQVALFSHCCRLAVTEGSIAHNAVFCRQGAELVILRKSDYVNTYQSAINAMNGLNVTYIDVNYTINVTDPWDGPFFLWRTKYLNEYFGENNRERSRWLSSLWYKYLIRVWREKLHLWFQ